jgi:hypothetical protein
MLSILRSIPTALLLAGASASGGTPGLVLEKKVGHLHFYKGAVVLTGEVERRTDKESLEQEGDTLCFKVSGESGIHIPRDGDQRAAWFCFSERDAAIRLLKLPATPAKATCGYRVPVTVVVGNYVVNRQESEVFDTASLLQVRHRGPLRPIPCG